MKNTIVLPLFLGLVLAGCNRTQTDSQKLSSSNQPDATKQGNPTYDANTAVPTADSSAPAQFTAVPTVPPAAVPAAVPAEGTYVATETPKITPDSPLRVDPLPPVSPPMPALTTLTPAQSAQVAVTPEGGAPVPTENAAGEAKPAIAARLAEWKLTADEIKDEFETSGRVARSKVVGAGEPTGPMDDVIVALINRKLTSDVDASAMKIVVSAADGVVTLEGTSRSLDQIGRALAIALDTGGVTQAISTIKLNGLR